MGQRRHPTHGRTHSPVARRLARESCTNGCPVLLASVREDGAFTTRFFRCHPEAAQAFAKRRPANEGPMHFYLGPSPALFDRTRKLRSRSNPNGQHGAEKNWGSYRQLAFAKTPPKRSLNGAP
jgi:hypothetical protein